jgi:peptidoglycan DL-endopeptidase CwlO
MRSRHTFIALTITAASLGLVPGFERAAFAADPCTQVDEFIDEQERIQQKEEELTEDAVTAQDELNTLQQEIAKSEIRVAELEVELGKIQTEIGDLALQTFLSGDQIGGIGTLLTDSGSLSESVEREQYAQLALNAGQASTDDLDAAVNDLANERKLLDRKRAEAENYITVIADRLDEAKKYAEQLEAGEKKARVQCAEVVAAQRRAREAQELADAQATARRNAASRGNGGGGGGGNNGGGDNGGGGGENGGGDQGGGGDTGGGDNGGGGGDSGGGAGGYVPPPSAGASGAVTAALSQRGVPYRFAAASPGEAFDCSGLTSWAWGQAGVSLPHQSRAQYASTARVSKDEAQAGDLLFFHNPISHVALYLGDGTMVHAVRTGTTVSVSGVNWGKVVGVGRPG